MGTRGLMAFAVEDEIKAMYNHWDSYPTGLGQTICDWIEGLDESGVRDAIEQFKALKEIDPDVPPTAEEKERLMGYADLAVSTQSLDDWYVLLRNTQGIPAKTLESGFYEDGYLYGVEEYGYLIDLSGQTLEIYSSGYGTESGGRLNYGNLVQTLTFGQIRAGEADMDALETALYEED